MRKLELREVKKLAQSYPTNKVEDQDSNPSLSVISKSHVLSTIRVNALEEMHTLLSSLTCCPLAFYLTEH
jgi:hypothetical protein